MNYPSIGEYNQVIQQKGGDSFKTLKGINLIPSRTTPIKVYLFGSGAFAAVFKGKINEKPYAIRCFISAENETIERYNNICKYLVNLNSTWITKCEFIQNEISVNGKTYPVLKMEWINGVLINEFVTQYLSNNNVLSELQIKLVSICQDLEKNKIGHGDLQCGNIVISGNSTNFQIKLIDYDGMYVPDLASKKSIEKGRSEFQHPRRTLEYFNHEMDRFSFWVIITALEALKYDESLWLEVMQGGYNTLDNFLFTVHDFLNPQQSELFNRLHNLNSPSLKFYLENLMKFCEMDVSNVTMPMLYSDIGNPGKLNIKKNNDLQSDINNNIVNLYKSDGMYKIVSKEGPLNILTSTFQHLGTTPIELEKSIFKDKTIIISNGKKVNQLLLTSNADIIEVHLEQLNEHKENSSRIIHEKVDENKDEFRFSEKPKSDNSQINKDQFTPPIISDKKVLKKKSKNKKATTYVIFLIGIVLIFLIGLFSLLPNDSDLTQQEKQINRSKPINTAVEEEKQINTPKPINQNNNVKPIETAIDFRERIKDFFVAEDERDFARIYKFFSPNIIRYYHLNNPTYSDLKASYNKSWNSTAYSSNSIKKITLLSTYIYKVETVFEYYDIKKNDYRTINSLLMISFDKYGYITKLYVIKSESGEVNTKKELLNNTSSSNIKNNDKYYKGNYKYMVILNEDNISLYTEPSPTSYRLYKCPKGSKIYVIDHKNDNEFYRVFVNGYTGYMSKVWINRY